MKDKTINTEQGHWILAKMGKKVLRPGGKELTLKLIDDLAITSEDKVVEFAPGMGYTASLLLKKNPKSYTGIELNEEAVQKLIKIINGENRNIVNANAADTGLKDASADKLIGEAMLTMQTDYRKSEIISEAYRLLKKGGLYGIHELGLTPNEIDPSTKGSIQRKLAQVIRVNARPLTQHEWCELLMNEGFKIRKVYSSPMSLLKPGRIVANEGILRTFKIGYNIITHPKAKKRIMKMRAIFKEYGPQMTAFGIIAEK